MLRAESLPLRPGWRAPAWLDELARFIGGLVLAGLVFALVLLLFGKDPIRAYAEIFQGALGDSYGWTEVLVKMIPFVLAALATALPAQVGLINVGGEGQIYAGAIAATWVALTFGGGPAYLVLPAMVLGGFVGGGFWAGICGLLRAKVGLNETISTLLLNYVAIRLVDHLVHGPWKDPTNFNWPYTAEFAASARLPVLFGARVHLGLALAIGAVVLLYLLLTRTRWGYEMRVVGANAEAGRRGGLPVGMYIVAAMVIAGGLAGIAGMSETSAIQGRLRAGISNGYGYVGFLASWLAGAHPLRIVITSALLAVVSVGGDVIQIAVNLPASTINILMALILFGVLGTRRMRTGIAR